MTRSTGVLPSCVVLPAILLASVPVHAGDWPRYRGPNHDGITSEQVHLPAPELWRANVGVANGSVSVSEGRVYTAGHRGGLDVLYCFDVDSKGTATPLWTFSYPGNAGYMGGPHPTPTVHENEVYMLSQWGRLHVVDKETGALLWQAATDWGAPYYGFAGSPLIEGDLVILTAGDQGVAFHRKPPHNRVWPATYTKGMSAHSSPVPVTHDGQRQVVISGAGGVKGINPATGEIVWTLPFHFYLEPDPIVHDGKVWASSSHGAGSKLAAMGAGTLKPIYESKVCCWLNCALLWKEHLYFLSNADHSQTQGLRCVEFATGETTWAEKSIGCQSGLLMANGQLVILESGSTVSGRDNNPHDLIVAEVSPAGYREVARQKDILPRGTVVASPVVSNGRLYVRDRAGTLVCYDVSGTGPKITVTQPAGGEIWKAGAPQTVAWESAGDAGGQVKIDFAMDGGLEWTTLVAATPNDGSEAITAPALPGTQCRIRVSAVAGPPSGISKRCVRIVNPQGLLQLAQVSQTVRENAGSVSIAVERVSGAAGPASVRVRTSDDSAKAGADYLAVSNPVVSFADGETSKSVPAPVVNNSTYESDRRFNVQLSDAAGAALGWKRAGGITILDDERPEPLVWLKLDEASGTTAADSGTLRVNGKLANDPTWSPAGGRIKGALSLDGRDDCINLGNPPLISFVADTNDYTISLWFKASGPNGKGSLVSKLAGNSANKGRIQYHIFVDPQGCLGAQSGNYYGRTTIAAKTVTDGAWHLATLVNDRTNRISTLYLDDGTLSDTAARDRAEPDNGLDVLIGAMQPVPGPFAGAFPGTIDDVRFYAVPLSRNEVADLYHGGGSGGRVGDR